MKENITHYKKLMTYKYKPESRSHNPRMETYTAYMQMQEARDKEEQQLRNKLVELYKELEIPDEVPEHVVHDWQPLDQIYDTIYKKIATDPAKYKPVVDRISQDNIITCFDLETRNNISKLYPEDEDIAMRLLIDTTSYYKIKYHPNDSGSWEDEDCDKEYKLITNCLDIYFTYKFDKICWDNPAMNKILKDNNITEIGENFVVHPDLMKLYQIRNK